MKTIPTAHAWAAIAQRWFRSGGSVLLLIGLAARGLSGAAEPALLLENQFLRLADVETHRRLTDSRSSKPAEVLAEGVRLRVAGAHIPVSRDVRQNVVALSRAIQFAAREHADVLVTPEGSLSGYTPGFDAAATAQALAEVVRQAREANVALVLGTCFASADGARYNAQRFYDRAGNFLGFHSKILLCRRVVDPQAKGEIDFFQSTPLRTFTLDGLKVGGLICNDFWANPEWTPMPDPHLARQLAALGARMVFLSVNSGLAEGDELTLNRNFHESNLRLRARSAKVWLVVADAGDDESLRASNCPSGVVRPDGSWALKVDLPGEQFFAHTIQFEPVGAAAP